MPLCDCLARFRSVAFASGFLSGALALRATMSADRCEAPKRPG